MPRNDIRKFPDSVCPFCSLLCDDLLIERRGDALAVTSTDCARAARGFERSRRHTEPHVQGVAASLDAAVEQAARILSEARQPLIAGLGTDVAGCRAALALADACGAAVDHMHGDGQAAGTAVLQRRGWITTTLAEVKNRADLVVLVGTDGARNYPRFFERIAPGRGSVAGLKPGRRRYAFIGRRPAARTAHAPAAARSTLINCTETQLGETMALLRAFVRGAEPGSAGALTKHQTAALRRLAAALKAARYSVFVWAAGELRADSAELVIGTTCDLIDDLNGAGRSAGLALGGSDGGMSAANVCTWQTGFPQRVCFSDGAPAYDPVLYSTTSMIENRSCDALLWISGFDAAATPPETQVPVIALTRPSRKLALDSEVYIPVATPGVDSSGHLFRTDNVVCLPLRPVKEARALPAHRVLDAIRRGLERC